LPHDNVPAVYITLYFLLAACYFGFGALSDHLAFFVAIQNFGNCSGRNFCIFKSIDHAARTGAPTIVMASGKIKNSFIIISYFSFRNFLFS